jgi:hypothetical protein
LAVRVRDQDPSFVVHKGQTHLCIEGYPRSANSFFVALFLLANPEEQGHIAHHTHSIANIAQAVHYQIPTIVLIRDPVDAIVSGHMHGPDLLDYRVRYYIEFYEWVRLKQEQIVLADFGVATDDFNEVIDQVNRKYDVSFKRIVDLEAARREAFRHLRSADFVATRKRLVPLASRTPVPSAERDRQKAKVRPIVLSHKQIGVAQSLYEGIIAELSTGEGRQ